MMEQMKKGNTESAILEVKIYIVVFEYEKLNYKIIYNTTAFETICRFERYYFNTVFVYELIVYFFFNFRTIKITSTRRMSKRFEYGRSSYAITAG